MKVLVFGALLLGACHKEDAAKDTHDAGIRTLVPAPTSSLAYQLGANDAGRGRWNMWEDGPNCGIPPKVDEKKELGSGSTRYAGFYRVKGPPRQLADRDNQAPVRLRLATPTHAKAGAMFEMSATFMNAGDKPFIFERLVDGSFPHWRSPFVDTYVKEDATGDIYRWSIGPNGMSCGNVDPRTAEDFGRLEPKKDDKAPFGRHAPDSLTIALDKKGRYTVWLVYAACQSPGGLDHTSERDAPVPADMFEGEIASNGVVVEVE